MAADAIDLAIRSDSSRLDTALARQLPDLSRSTIQQLIRSGQVQVNGKIAYKPSAPVSAGDRVRLSPSVQVPERPPPEPIDLDIVYEDQAVLVVNKPAGMVVHPAPGHPAGTLVNAVLSRLPDLATGDRERPGIVHRLDKDTSGLILVAKHSQALAQLQRQFKQREVHKCYLGLVDGAPPTSEGEVQAAIGRDPRNRQRYTVLPADSGKPAVSRYRTRQKWAAHALLELEPITGRTHQLRIHLRALDCPIVGDRVYGRRNPSLPVERQMLHAWQLELTLPGAEAAQRFEAPIPEDLRQAIELASQRQA